MFLTPQSPWVTAPLYAFGTQRSIWLPQRRAGAEKVTCKIKVAVLQNLGTATFLSGLCVFVLFDYLTSFGDSFGDMIVNVVFAYNLVDAGIDECGVNIGIYTRQDDVDALFA